MFIEILLGQEIVRNTDGLEPLPKETERESWFWTGTSQYMYRCIRIYSRNTMMNDVPVVPHKAVAEVSRIGNYRRDWLL